MYTIVYKKPRLQSQKDAAFEDQDKTVNTVGAKYHFTLTLEKQIRFQVKFQETMIKIKATC